MRLTRREREALGEFVEACKEKFGGNLVSIVLFGSRVKGYARRDSDYDLLIIARNLPDIKERFDLLGKEESEIWDKYGIKISSLLFEEEEIFSPVNPLLFGVLSGYKVLFGRENSERGLKQAKVWIEEMDPIYVDGERGWRVKELIKS
ncbi:MAG: nucleotidyltransferase domain-containing protein [Candidatus Verstraetearchaeota archaeon]|nr:nucleotidyltransferase domain-containing protein [Candidatus Verstraetearchaeota archaeon]